MQKIYLAILAVLCLSAAASTVTASTRLAASNSGFNAELSSVAAHLPGVAAQVRTATDTGTTWYIRPDGGTRYSTIQASGQCDGQSDKAYPGSGVNQHCAFNDYRFLWDDQSYGNDAWVIAGGDTVILRGGPWRVGFNQSWPNDTWCVGGQGPYACGNPTIPAGTASRHTRILGENFASCTATNKTQIFGGHAVNTALNMTGAKYVDVQCLDITRHSDCIRHGFPVYPSGCSSAFPLDDFDGDGITMDNTTSDVALTDLWIHGHTDRGIIGPIGGLVTCLRCVISYNGMAGWDFDDGHATPFGAGATWKFLNSIIEWNGCNQQYPAVDTYPALSCYSQSTGGYGDGVGSATNTGTGMSVVIDHSIFRYNTQDGLDLGHIDAGNNTLSITNSAAYGNNGGQFKWGAYFQTANFTNNVVLANCLRMSKPIAGTPSTYNANLSDFCRAQDAISFNFVQGGRLLFANNTLVSYASTSYDIACWTSSCSNSTFTFKNNLTLGYDNATTYTMGGQVGGPGDFYYQNPIGNVVRKNNLWYGMRNIGPSRCPATDVCADPLLVAEPLFTGESSLDAVNFTPALNSPAGAAAPTLLSLDVAGIARPSPFSAIGAAEAGTNSLSLASLASLLTQGAALLAPLPVEVPTSPVTITSPPNPTTTTPTPTTPTTSTPTTTTPTTTTPTTTTPTTSSNSWFRITVEMDNTYVALPSLSTYRFGTDPLACPTGMVCNWITIGPLRRSTTVLPYYRSFSYDPAPGVLKELDILQRTSPQTVALIINGRSSTIVVPAK
jgi:hypothetical protein